MTKQPANGEQPANGRGQVHVTVFNFGTLIISLKRVKLGTSKLLAHTQIDHDK